MAQLCLFEMDKGWHYVLVPSKLSKPFEHLSERGLIAIMAKVGKSTWATSMLPMGDGTHFIALPAKVRNKENLLLGSMIEISFNLRKRS